MRFEVLTAMSIKMAISGLLRLVDWYKFTDVPEVLSETRTQPTSGINYSRKIPYTYENYRLFYVVPH